jgi:archaellum component FlaF (FlaF/FlaG flagellin family)
MIEQGNHRSAFEDLIVGHFDGNLSVDQERELAKAIAESPESKRLFLSYMRLEGRLHSLGHDGFLSAVDAQPENTLNTRPEHRQRSRLWAASSSIAVCGVLIAILGWGLWPSSVNANSVLQKAQQAAAELIDRTYRVTISQTNEHSQSQTLTINVRGGGRFVIQPADGAYVMGNDGTDYWMTQADGPVWVTNDFRSVAPELQRQIPNRRLLGLAASPDEPLLTGVSELLSLIQRKYNVELIESATAMEHHIHATLNSSRRNHPEVIDLWSDVESGVVLRAEVKWSNGMQRRFELVESVKLSQQWYHHSAHAPGRKVERIHAASQP